MARSESSRSSKIPLVKQIAERILEFDSQSIPADVLRHAKFLILDSIGCALAARGEHAFERTLHTFESIGGNADCTIIGISAPDAGYQRGDAQRDPDPRAGPE
jgi:2-methylcitrate dehydratase PrpD